MKIKGTKTERIAVELDVEPRELFYEIQNHIARSFNAHICDAASCSIDSKGRIVEEVEHRTSHSYYSTEVRIAEPTDEQKDVVNAIKVIGFYLHKIEKKS